VIGVRVLFAAVVAVVVGRTFGDWRAVEVFLLF
jgi:hypothetical protein